MTGDYSQMLVLQYGDILMSTNASAVNVTPITNSTTDCKLNCAFFILTFHFFFLLAPALFLNRATTPQDPTIALYQYPLNTIYG